MSHYVHYTVKLPPEFVPQFCTAGPYTVDEVLAQRQGIAGYAHIHNIFVSELPAHPDGVCAMTYADASMNATGSVSAPIRKDAE